MVTPITGEVTKLYFFIARELSKNGSTRLLHPSLLSVAYLRERDLLAQLGVLDPDSRIVLFVLFNTMFVLK